MTNSHLPIVGNSGGLGINQARKPARSPLNLFARIKAALFARPPAIIVPRYSVKKIDAKAERDAKAFQMAEEMGDSLSPDIRQRLERMRRKAVK